MNKGFAALTALFMSITLASCSSNTQEQNTTLGAVTGAVVGAGTGAFIGQGVGKAVAVGVGLIGGALIGGYIGNHMDSSDHAKMNNAMNNPTYKETSWKNEKTGATYSMQPTSNSMAMNGNANCRQFHTTATIDGKKQETDGTACRQADGTWQSIKT